MPLMASSSLAGLRPAAGQLGERLVAEDVVHRHARLVGDLAPPVLQGLQDLGIGRKHLQQGGMADGRSADSWTHSAASAFRLRLLAPQLPQQVSRHRQLAAATTPCPSSLPRRIPSSSTTGRNRSRSTCCRQRMAIRASIISRTSVCVRCFSSPNVLSLFKPQLGHLGAARAAEHLGDEVLAAGEPGLGAGHAAEDHPHRFQNLAFDSVIVVPRRWSARRRVPAPSPPAPLPTGEGRHRSPALAPRPSPPPAVVAMAASGRRSPRRNSAGSPAAGTSRSGRSGSPGRASRIPAALRRSRASKSISSFVERQIAADHANRPAAERRHVGERLQLVQLAQARGRSSPGRARREPAGRGG